MIGCRGLAAAVSAGNVRDLPLRTAATKKKDGAPSPNAALSPLRQGCYFALASCNSFIALCMS